MVTDNKNLQETSYKLSLHTLLTCTCVQACCLYICICTMLHHCGPAPTARPVDSSWWASSHGAPKHPRALVMSWLWKYVTGAASNTHTHTMPMFCGINQLLWHLLAFRLSTLTALGSTRIALAWLVVVHCGVPNGVRSTCPAMHWPKLRKSSEGTLSLS